MIRTISLRTLFFASFLLALVTVPSPARAYINLNLGDGEDGNTPVKDALCVFFNCSDNGDLEKKDVLVRLIAEAYADFESNFGGRRKQRQLRGNDEQTQELQQERLLQQKQQRQLRKSWRESSHI